MALFTWNRKFGVLLLGIWLIASGAVQLVPALTFQGHGTVLSILAVVAGIVLILDR